MKHCLNTPIGVLELYASENYLTEIIFLNKKSVTTCNPEHPVLKQAEKELEEYFSGERKSFDVPLELEGTEFQQEVWNALRTIPYGKAISYGELAKKLGDPNKMRAVGSANGKNPIPIIVPCHRVIRADNTIGGYSGGIERKKFLLKHEGALLL